MIGKSKGFLLLLLLLLLLLVCLTAVSCSQEDKNNSTQGEGSENGMVTSGTEPITTDLPDTDTEQSEEGDLVPEEDDSGDFGEFIPAV